MEESNKMKYENIHPNAYCNKPKITSKFPFDNSNPLNQTRKSASLSNNILFEVENLLSQEECKFLINTAEEKKYDSISWEYDSEYRTGQRQLIYIEDLAKILYERLVPLFIREGFENIRPYGIGTEGKWFPSNINNCFRFTKYNIRDSFEKHIDSGFVYDDNNRSIFTLMIYLNEDFKDGETVFVENGKEIVIKPQKGKGLVFNHDIEHKGNKVKMRNPLNFNNFSKKIIIRTDIMFFRLSNYNDLSYLNSKEYHQAEDLFTECLIFRKKINQKNQLKNTWKA